MAPMGVYVPPLSPNDHPTTAIGPLGFVGGHPRISIFWQIHAGLKMVTSSPVGAHKGGQSGKLGDSTKDPHHWLGASLS